MTGFLNYTIEDTEGMNIQINWSGKYRDVMVKVNNNLIGMVDDKAGLKEGAQFMLEDGSLIGVKLGALGRMHVSHNGRNLRLSRQ